MIRYEIKKIFSKSLSKVSLVVLLFSLLISCYFAITNVSFLDEQGKSHTGIAAAKSLREEKQKWKGVLDEAALQAVLDEYKKISEEYPIRPGDDSANLLHDSKVQGFSEIKDMINMGFCEFRDFNYYRIDSLSKEEVGQIYENRGKSLEKWLNSEDADGLFDENEKAFLIEQYREMKAPLYYEDYDGWKSALSYAQTIIMLIMLVSAFLVSGIFSNEFSWKSDSIFFSTKYGRDRGTRAKIMAGFIVVSVIYFIVISLYSLVVLGCLGSQGGNVMIQTGFWHWKSFYNITYMQLYLLTVVAGYIGTVSIILFSDNVGNNKLHNIEFTDFCKEYPNVKISMQKTGEIFHDRFIVLDYGTADERVFLCGASSKDAGARITSIVEDYGTKKYASVMATLLQNPPLVLPK